MCASVRDLATNQILVPRLNEYITLLHWHYISAVSLWQVKINKSNGADVIIIMAACFNLFIKKKKPAKFAEEKIREKN